jgi:hypothetical protein
MVFSFLNWLMLFGLATVAIPPIIHLLNRRRYLVVDWGAMQFLRISDARRRRLLIEELLLMLLRMGLIAVMVLALALPYAVSPLFEELGLRQNRDVALVFGGSAGMAAHGSHDAAKRWALRLLDTLAPGDGVVVLQAKKQVVPLLAEPTRDLDLARRVIRDLPPPGGGCDWPQAVQEAQRILARSGRPTRHIILLGDGQRTGWSDPHSLGYWEALADDVPADADLRPGIWALNFDPRRAANPPNWSLSPIRGKRVTAYVKQDVELETDLLLHGQATYEPPEWVRLEVDSDHDHPRPLPFPSRAEFERDRPPAGGANAGSRPPVGQRPTKQDVLVVPLPPFKHQFQTPGSHLVSVLAKPKGGRPVRQDYAVEVLALPVLIVDGDGPTAGGRRRSDALRLALDPRRDRAKQAPSALVADVVPAERFDPAVLNPPADKRRPEHDPRVLILADVPQLSAAQQKGVAQFLAAGGGVLVLLGGHAEASQRHYNDELFADGRGWLPARLERVVPAGTDRAAGPLLASFNHPALEMFRQESFGGLNDANFARWWEVRPAEGKNKGVTVARLTSRDPLLVEGRFRGGRVLLCTVPLQSAADERDEAWDTSLIKLPSFVPLLHELAYYLAGNLSAAGPGNVRIRYNLTPGQPLYYAPDGGVAEDRLTLAIPGQEPRPLVLEGPAGPDVHRARLKRDAGGSEGSAAGRQLVDFPGTYHTGVYTLRVPRRGDWLPAELGDFFEGTFRPRHTVYYAVHSDDPAEFDLTPATAAERARVAAQVPMTYERDGDRLLGTLVRQADAQEMWWVLMLAVIGLLCAEVWLTRRISRAR